MENDFTVDKVSWHTKKVRNYYFDNNVILRYFETAIRFFQDNGLTTKVIVNDFSNINDDTCIKASDLTKEGILLVKKAYGKWADYVVDKNMPGDTSILERALKKIRSK
ncbi:MAG: hypothetical protein NVV59_08985 [Chitinophagaceae bacterium]|nr:hypothetical protein [Chitinophagaceae bacterium]